MIFPFFGSEIVKFNIHLIKILFILGISMAKFFFIDKI